MTQLALGADTQPTRIGLALVTIEDEPRPLWADTFSVRRPMTKLGPAVRDAIRAASARADELGGEVVRVGIERAVVIGPTASADTCWDSGGVYALARDGCERVWKATRLRIESYRPGQWKVAAMGQGHGNDRADLYALWARRWCREEGWDEVRMNGLAQADACAALGLAKAVALLGGAA